MLALLQRVACDCDADASLRVPAFPNHSAAGTEEKKSKGKKMAERGGVYEEEEGEMVEEGGGGGGFIAEVMRRGAGPMA